MSMERWILLTAPSGVRIQDTIKKFQNSIGKDVSSDQCYRVIVSNKQNGAVEAEIIFSDIETELVRQTETQQALKTFRSVFSSEALKVYTLPPDLLARFLERATNQSIDNLKRLAKDRTYTAPVKVMVLCTHFALYNKVTDEFRVRSISLADKNIKFSLVITLVDDIYDEFFHLTRKDAVFDNSAKIYSEDLSKRMLPKNQQRNNVHLTKNEDKFFQQLGRAHVLDYILEWRQTEIRAAEEFASREKLKYIVLGVKQPITVLSDLLLKENVRLVYLSHPITSVRHEANQKPNYLESSEIVRKINLIQSEISKKSSCNLITIVPTAIDELRMGVKEIKTTSGKREFYNGYLTERWPFVSSLKSLLYVPPCGKGKYSKEEIDKMLYMKYSQTKGSRVEDSLYCRAGPTVLIETLFEKIRRQIVSRDRFLVSYLDNILVFRPLYNEAEYSKGTKNELIQWVDRVRSDKAFRDPSEKRAVIIHNVEDVKSIISSVRRIENNTNQTTFWGSGAATGKKAEELNKEKLLGILFPIEIEKAKDFIGEIIGIWIVNDSKEFNKILPSVISFLMGGKPKITEMPQWWEKRSKSFF